ncbi:MAG: AAA family ATPase [Candidatus Paracaedimonas acanthamoebae]|jgi:Ti-type conjugative transfer relaxase TraA|uniref:AAA family ATPase n=1 Tax=Candidatus Paracaedimonas acanthamoebae TaxID=244581 RepID=A0A8J7TVK3_9PROT|nr:AAA family ATPase [Candidatus Paracaedimonas acanthamoebae]
MALAHGRLKMISRSKRNTVRALAYRTGCKIYDPRTGELMTTRKKMYEVQHVELLLPKDSPEWALNLRNLIEADRQKGVQKFSDIVEAAEKRKDAQVYREYEFALPHEFTDEQCIKLANEFIQDQMCGQGMAVLANFHFDVDEDTGERKPHCHALMLTRRLTEKGLSLKKEVAWNRRSLGAELREQLVAYTNFHLKMYGFDERLDHRSYTERGIEIEPQPKRGTNIKAAEFRKGNNLEDLFSTVTTEKAIAFRETKLRNVCRLIRNPDIVLRDIVSKHHATFMWGDVEKVLNRYIDDKDLYKQVEQKLKSSKELLLLRYDTIKHKDGTIEDHSIYTTRTMLESEMNLVQLAERLNKAKSHEVNKNTVNAVITRFDQKLSKHGGLSSDQKKALHHITSSDQLSCIVGYAGAGKTTALEAAKEIWEAEGYKVYGLAPTGRAAQNLVQSGISSQTLHKFLYSHKEGRCQYKANSILILDEAGMVGTERFDEFLQAVDDLKVKAVIVGDGAQLQPVEAGPAFRLVTGKIGSSHLEKIVRQEEAWQQKATKLFGILKTTEALQEYYQKGYVQFIEEKKIPIAELIETRNHTKIVETYNLSRRMVGNIYHSMIEDLKEANREEKNPYYHLQSHKDYALYREWHDIKMACATYMRKNLDPCRPYMKELGVDPQYFAEQFVNKDLSLKEQKLEAAHLACLWELPQLDPDQRKHMCELREETKKALIQEWHASFKEDPQKSHLMMTYSKTDTAKLNEEARHLLKQDGMISKEEYLHTIHKEDEDDFGDKIVTNEEKHFAKGDRILFLRNDNGFGVRNGTLGTILEIDRYKIKAKLDHTGDIVSFAPKLYPYFDQGWAANIHKSQGVTVDRAFLLATHETYSNLAYVGMTRHREFVKVFGSKLDFWREEIFFKRLSSSQEKLSSLDYVRDYDNINLPNKNSKLQEILNRLGNELQAIRFVSKQAWESIAERFLGKLPEQQEIRIAQQSMSEHIRAKELLEEHDTENNKLYKKYIEQEHSIKNASNSTTTRTSKNQTNSTGVRQSTEKKDFKQPLFPHKVAQESQTLASDNLKGQQQQQLETKAELTGFERIKSLIDSHKLARTEAERKQAEMILKQYAQELYKQDPTLKSIRDKDSEITKQIRAILFEEGRNKLNDREYQR